jgi:hypothetical protein
MNLITRLLISYFHDQGVGRRPEADAQFQIGTTEKAATNTERNALVFIH